MLLVLSWFVVHMLILAGVGRVPCWFARPRCGLPVRSNILSCPVVHFQVKTMLLSSDCWQRTLLQVILLRGEVVNLRLWAAVVDVLIGKNLLLTVHIQEANVECQELLCRMFIASDVQAFAPGMCHSSLVSLPF